MNQGKARKPVIKIFVSHRIDQVSETIDNPLYVNVRCGAVFDQENNSKLMGDDTGDNISTRRMSFCELTVQYWAWKNVDADYYGLCHYRRYLSFDSKIHEVAKSEHDNGCIGIDYLTSSVIDEYHLDYDHACRMMEEYDVIACNPIDASKTNIQAMKDSPDYHNINDMYEVLQIIHEKYPEMDSIANEYMHSKKVRLYNCWLMRKDIFQQYSEWLFSILFELEKRIKMSNYGLQKYRTPGTIGERLFGIYCLYLSRRKDVRFKDQELLFIEHPEKQEVPKPFWEKDQITLVSNFNNNYVPAFSVSLCSFLDHVSRDEHYEIIVLTEDISSGNRNILERMVSKYANVHLTFYNPFPLLSNIKLFVNNAVYTKDLYVRVIIPFALENFDKVLVVDADTIIKKDLAILFRQDLGNYLMAAVQDVVYGGYLNGVVPGTMDYAKNKLQLDDPYGYCNTGVILLNCNLIRHEFKLKDVLHEINIQKYRIFEQDMLNVLYKGRIKYLDPRWNLFTYTNPSIEKCVQMAPLKEYQAYDKARKEPFIIHYADQPKPWFVRSGDYVIEFWRYARNTDFYEGFVSSLAQAEMLSTLYAGGGRLSFVRRVADKLLPKGSKRREALKKVMPRGSKQFEFLKRMYHKFSF